MQTSRPIEVHGRFLGVAVTLAGAWRFIATDPVVEDLDGNVFATPAEAHRVASLVLNRASRPTGQGGVR